MIKLLLRESLLTFKYRTYLDLIKLGEGRPLFEVAESFICGALISFGLVC